LIISLSSFVLAVPRRYQTRYTIQRRRVRKRIYYWKYCYEI